MKHFSGRVAFVVGGTTGIGYSLVRQFLALDMKVVVVGHNLEHLEGRRREFAGCDTVRVVHADVTDRDQMCSAAREAIRAFGKIHVLCNNAAALIAASVDDPNFEPWDRAFDINFGGVVNGVKIIVPLILSHGEGGHVLNTSSIAGIIPLPRGGGGYMTAKAAVRALTTALRLELAPHGIGVSCLCPGLTRTPIHSNEEILAVAMDPEEVAAAAIDGIRNNTPCILTHAEIRDEVREMYEKLDGAFLQNLEITGGRQRFEDQRRTMVAELQALPVKD